MPFPLDGGDNDGDDDGGVSALLCFSTVETVPP